LLHFRPLPWLHALWNRMFVCTCQYSHYLLLSLSPCVCACHFSWPHRVLRVLLAALNHITVRLRERMYRSYNGWIQDSLPVCCCYSFAWIVVLTDVWLAGCMNVSWLPGRLRPLHICPICFLGQLCPLFLYLCLISRCVFERSHNWLCEGAA